MKGAFLYVDAGMGHYIPAVALADAFKDLGHEVVVEDLYIAFRQPALRWVSKYNWRFLLHHPNYEKKFDAFFDNKNAHTSLIMASKNSKATEYFKEWFYKNRPDFIIVTNFMGATILPAVLKKLGLNCPVYDYVADLFDQVKGAIDNNLTMCYVPTALGVEHTIQLGQDPSKTKLCPFPLSKKFEVSEKLTKKEAREKLGLKDKFTVLWNLGGEGIGNPKILYGLVKRGLDVQVVTIGGKSKDTELKFEVFKKENPDFDLEMRGFVDNAQEYIMACDLQMGKAGANSLMESLYLKRPFLITEVLYMARSTQLFFDSYPVGWTSDKLEEKLDIIEKAYKDPEVLKKIDEQLNKLPVDFSAPHFAQMLIKDTLQYRKTNIKNY